MAGRGERLPRRGRSRRGEMHSPAIGAAYVGPCLARCPLPPSPSRRVSRWIAAEEGEVMPGFSWWGGGRRWLGVRSRQVVAVEALEGRELLSTYYVATNGTDDNPGTAAKPFRTI